MSASRLIRADHLVPDDRILRNGRRYRVTLVRHVPAHPERGTPLRIEIEASPEQHDGAALVASYEPHREFRLASTTREGAFETPAWSHAAVAAVVLAIVLSATATSSLAATRARITPVDLSERLIAPCRARHVLQHASDQVGPPSCRLELAPMPRPRQRWRT